MRLAVRLISQVALSLGLVMVGLPGSKPVARELNDEQAAASDQRGRRTPAFTLEEVARTPMWGQYALSPDKQWAAYTLVSRYFSHPVIPRASENGNIRMVSLATGETVVLTGGASPKTVPRFSPDGQRVSFEAEGDIWAVDVRSGRTRRLTTDQTPDTAAVWSPNGARIAFVSRRSGWHGPTERLPMTRPASRIWVMSAEGDNEELLQVTAEPVAASDLSWSPSGDRLLFVAQGAHYFSRQIFVVPARGGRPARLTPDDASWNTVPRWSPDGNRIAFISDRSGFRNVWLMRADGSEARQLARLEQDQDYSHNEYVQTKGLFWSPDGTRILCFAIRDGNLDLVIVDVATGRADRTSTEDGQYHPVGWLDDRAIAYVYENHFTPPDLYVQPIGQPPRRVTWSRRATFRREHLGMERRVSFTSADGLQLHGFLLTPGRLAPDEKLPGIVFLHTYCPGQNYHEWNPLFSYIVESGYVLLRVDQRGSSGYGRRFLELAPGTYTGKIGEDVVAGANFLKAHPNVDPDRLAVMGYSFGGFLVNNALVKNPDVFRAGVSVFGTVDRRGQRRGSWAYYMGGYEEEIPEAYEAASPVLFVKNLKAPVILIGGMEDTTVDTTQTYRYVHALESAGKYYELFMYPGEQHGLRDVDHQLDSYRQVMAFLNRFLQ